MPPAVPQRYAFNRTRQSWLATQLRVAGTHWSRLCGLMGTSGEKFCAGQGLWIVPCHGVHTFAMRFPIDVIYLDGQKVVIYVKTDLRPWRLAPVRMQAASVLELPPATLASTGTSVGDQIEIAVGAPQNGGRA
jgi:uncharacterized membrane protein (UPF0127 family)